MSSTLAERVADQDARRAHFAAPAVAVSSTSDDTLGGAHRVRLNSAYVSALENAGIIPVIVPPLASEEAAAAILSRVDGVVLTGGEDVEPSLYGQPRLPECGRSNRARDNTEIALVRAARSMSKPLLAICRGVQVVNVALGGTLYQDIPSQLPGALDHDPKGDRGERTHGLNVEPGSRIAHALQATRLSVNSFHHQSIMDVAPGLRVTATAPDGVIEGIEPEGDDWWMMAVQWHPEEMNDSPDPWDRGVFRAFAGRLSSG